MKRFTVLAILLLFLIPIQIFSSSNQNAEIIFFYSDDCSPCAQMKPFIEMLIANNPSLDIKRYSIEEDETIWRDTCHSYGIQASGVPRLFINDTCFVGWMPTNSKEIYMSAYCGYLGNPYQILKSLKDKCQLVINVSEEYLPYLNEV